MLDVDHFKKINDTYGHDIGDSVLKDMASIIKGELRDRDSFARWGGEEFVILFPETSSKNAVKICEKLRIGISQLEHSTAGKITVSFGVTQLLVGDKISSMFERCDAALYKSKKNGRNCVTVF